MVGPIGVRRTRTPVSAEPWDFMGDGVLNLVGGGRYGVMYVHTISDGLMCMCMCVRVCVCVCVCVCV